MEKVIAVVVTYNRQSLLSECIDALRCQTKRLDAILVVNNGSTDNTSQWLKEQSDVFVIDQANVGSSGGFNAGISWAFKNGYTWIWCMDDDGYPKEDALQNLLAADDGNLRLLNCAVIDKANRSNFVWKTKQYQKIEDVDTKIIEGIGHPFNGTMLHRKIVERVGVPQARFFLWGDESEYYYRIVKRNNIPVCTVADSIHYHPAAAFSIRQDWDYDTSWKMYFYVRNRLYIHKAKFTFSLISLFNYCCFLAAFAGVVIFYQKTDKLKKLSFILWPVADAFSSNFEATPQLILTKLKATRSVSVSQRFNYLVKGIWASMLSPFTTQRNSNAVNA